MGSPPDPREALGSACSALTALAELASGEADEQALQRIGDSLRGGGDAGDALQQLSELARQWSAPGLVATFRAALPFPDVGPGHVVQDSWVCPAEPRRCTRVEMPDPAAAPEKAPHCALLGKDLRLLRVVQ